MYKERGPQLNEHVRTTKAALYENTPGLTERLDAFWKIVRTPEERIYLSAKWDFDMSMSFLAERVLIVNLNAFEDVIAEIRNSVKEVGKAIKRIAKLENDIEKRSAKIVPIHKK